MTSHGNQLSVTATPIPGLLVVDLPVHGDSRGWFKENWQREKMIRLGVPDFGPVQNNVSFNDAAGTTRGIHAEPWDKYVSVVTGRIFGAWVDLRDGPEFGTVFTTEVDPSRAVYVPRGVGNAYQTLEPDTSYAYLVNDHWSPDAHYTFLNLADETVAIPWPVPLENAHVSDKDLAHPRLHDVTPVTPRRVLVTGASGQVGRALRARLGDKPWIEYATRDTLDLASPGWENRRRWRDYGTIINAAAYTAVDTAETAQGRLDAWAVNVTAVSTLARIAEDNGITLVHISSDYVFDGSKPDPYTESDPVCPIGVYGQTKAAGDAIVGTVPRHYIVRTSWVIGEGKNFIRTMAQLAERGANPTVVDDQVGRLTFAPTIAEAVVHLLESSAPYGTYNVTNSGAPQSWYSIAKTVFEILGHDPKRVTPTTTREYMAAATVPTAIRPARSVLDISAIERSGYHPVAMDVALAAQVERVVAT